MISVSIVTISHYQRANFLRVLAKCIKKQDYSHIMEWIIVDTSFVGYYQSNQDLTDVINEFRNDKHLPKIIYAKSSKRNIGGWRNESNDLVGADIVVCMDDDDYYPPERISHAVDRLKNNKGALMAGCDKLLFYDIHFDKIYQHHGVGSFHSTNNCMAYRKEYLKNHRYDETVKHAEEDSFTDKFSVSMVQLEPEKTVLNLSHDRNTYNKKRIILHNCYLEPTRKYITVKETRFGEFIVDKEIVRDYENIFIPLVKPEKSAYDIVYYMGMCPLWSPLQDDLGGSEQAVKYLTIEWARYGKKVAVYGNLSWTGTYQNVEYCQYYNFHFWDEYRTLIFWRMAGCLPYLSIDLKANKILADIHDNFPPHYELLLANKEKITSWMVKSEFHHYFIEAITKQPIPNAIVIPNGIRIPDFSKTIIETRIPYRMCYCSYYNRGLYRILKSIWPFIYQLEPRAELHTYYGMDMIDDKDFVQEMRKLLAQPGVMDHGRQSVEIINREKHLSTFQFYYSDNLAEIDCISVRESLVAGCIPIISNVNMFRYRDGVHIQWFPDTEEFNRQIASGIVELMQNTNLQNELRIQYYKSPTITSWSQCAAQWLGHMQDS